MKKIHYTYFNRALLTLLTITSLVTSTTGTSIAANKSIVETGPHSPSQEVTVQIEFSEPDIVVTPSVEMVVVVDTSRSISVALSDMKTKLINFVDNDLVKYPGAIRMGITKVGNGTASFDSNNSNNPVANTQMFHSGTTNALPNSSVGIDKVVTIDADNIAEFRNAVSAITIEPDNNPNSPDGANNYTSDIGPGLGRATGMFTAESGISRFVVLLTDAMATRGYCPINGSGNPAVAFPTGTQLQVLPGGDQWHSNDYVQTDYRTADSNFPASYPYDHGEPGVCYPFVHNFYSSTGLRSQTFTQEIASRYGGVQSTDIVTTTFDKVIERAKLSSITLKDTLNSSVFSGITTWVGLFDCSSGTPGTQYTGSSWTVSGNTGTLIIPTSVIDSVDEYCVRFKATIATNPPSGSQPINSSSGNTVTFKNNSGQTLATENIGQGSMSIVSDYDLRATSLILNDADSDLSKRVFAVGEDIYLNAQMRNHSTRAVSNTVTTTFHKTQSTPATAGQWTDIPSSISINNWPASTSYQFRSRPGSSTRGNFTGNTSWVGGEDGAADFRARMHVNYQEAGGAVKEADYSNNQATLDYSVVTVPVGNPADSVVCDGVTLSWSASSANTTNYSLRYRQGSGAYTTLSSIGNRTNYPLTGLAPNANYNWQIAVHTKNGMSDWFTGGSFTTPSCPVFELEPRDPVINLQTDGSAAPYNALIDVEYLPTVGRDAAWGNPVGRIQVNVIGVFPGDVVCPTNARTTPSGDYGGITVRHNSGGLGREISYNTTPVPFTIQVSDTTVSQQYSICFGGYSNQAHITDTDVTKILVSAIVSPWVQIDRPDGMTESKVGDVHSNGGIGIHIPVNQFFFRGGTAGVVSAKGSVSMGNVNRIAANPSNPSNPINAWRVDNYPNVIQTRTFDSLVSLYRSSQNDPGASIPSIPSGSFNSICARGSGAFLYEGDYTRNSAISMQGSPQCQNAHIIFFIDGNVTHNANIVDGTNGGTLTFISSGNVTVSPNVTRLDGVHIFAGRFDSGSKFINDGATVDDPLVIHGSLIGLAGNSPSTTTGSFAINDTTRGLHRNLGLGNAATPAERIVFQPKYLYHLRELLGTATYSWREDFAAGIPSATVTPTPITTPSPITTPPPTPTPTTTPPPTPTPTVTPPPTPTPTITPTPTPTVTPPPTPTPTITPTPTPTPPNCMIIFGMEICW